jgi:Tol biopolymer transport system component
VTFDSASTGAEWSNGGKHLVYLNGRAVMRIAVDGSGVAETLLVRPRNPGEVQESRDGRTLILRDGPGGGQDIWLAARGDTGWTVRPLLRTPFAERNVALSHDGHWLAYVSNESGNNEVYVRRLEEGSGRWKVSRTGGFEPRWGPADRELYFRVGDSLVVTQMQPGPEPRFSDTRMVLTGEFVKDANRPAWDIAPDGSRFVFSRDMRTTETREMTIVLNWFDQFRKPR